jgi:pimeloyl-ACP methyl ester carboxylesterase
MPAVFESGLNDRIEHDRVLPTRAASYTRGRVLLGLAVGLLIASACGEQEDPDLDTVVPPALVPDSGASPAVTAADTGAPATSGVSDSGAAPTTRMDSGATTPAADAGTQAASDSGPVADTGAPSAEAGTPLVLPPPEMPGPYEVVKLENVGMGFENPPTAANDRGDGAGCTSFIQSFGETPEAARDYALFGTTYKVDLYTLYYPKNMVEGQLYPILSWANGTCAKTNGYHVLLNHLASHGFIVVATNSRYTGGGKFQMHGVDYVVAENNRAESPLYKHVDATKVGVFGHSQGGGSTWSAAMDPRVKTSVVLNAGGSGTRATPTYFVTGDKDLNPEASLSGAMAQKAAASIRLHKIDGAAPAGHITLMKEPERVYPSVNAWFRYQLLGDAVGKSWFVGSDCKLCNKPAEWDFFTKGLQ